MKSVSLLVVVGVLMVCIPYAGTAASSTVTQERAQAIVGRMLVKDPLYKGAYSDPFPGKESPHFFVF